MKLHRLLSQRADQKQHPGLTPGQEAAGAEVLVIVGVNRLSAELLQVVGGCLLDEDVFGIAAEGHSLNLCLM
ncbi:MAG: hypothetical protein LUQ44_02060 [Methanothrix sp.]|nr:hypothetical protein [Methanothrix sp.]